ncbi:MAG: hypothetical protein RL676_835, partial [Pseudomonadota bacterium]
ELDITKPRTMPVLGWDFDRTKRICVWYVLWYAETKKRPEGAYLLGIWRRL